jgi:hypothetical protein
VHKRLAQHSVSEYQGFQVPRLVNFNSRLLVIEMSVVDSTGPFLLDFAGSTLDHPPDFPEGTDEWWERVRGAFGEDFDTAQTVYWGLVRDYGIYYWDLKPGNLQIVRPQSLP